MQRSYGEGGEGAYPHLRFCDKDWRGVECRVGQECFTSVMREWFSAMDKYLLLLLLTITSEDDHAFGTITMRGKNRNACAIIFSFCWCCWR